MLSGDLEIVAGPPSHPEYIFRTHRGPVDGLLFPSPEIANVLGLVVPDPALWPSTRIRVSSESWRQKRLPIFGPSFSKAIRAVVSTGFTKSRSALPNSEMLEGTGLVADLIVHVARCDSAKGRVGCSSFLQVEAWEPLGRDGEVFYVHGIFSADDLSFEHLDGSVIWFSAYDLMRLVNDGKKLKGRDYKKQFRLDGNVAADMAFELVRQFLLYVN